MKRRQLLKLLGLAPPLLLAACKDDFPSTPTIATGKVVFEDDSPVQGVILRLTGSIRQGLTLIDSFVRITTDTNQEGIYTLSQIVPKGTDLVEIIVDGGSFDEPNPGYGYRPYIFVDGSYLQMSAPYKIPYFNYGKTITFNFQLRKQ